MPLPDQTEVQIDWKTVCVYVRCSSID